MEAQAAAVVGDPVLGIIIGADLLRAFRPAHLGAARFADLGVVTDLLGFEQPGPEHGHGPLLVLELGTFILTNNGQPRRFVDYADGRGNLVYVLSAVAAGVKDIDP